MIQGTSRNTSFDAALKVGGWAVSRIEDRLRSQGHDIENVERDMFFQSLDVDLLMHSPHSTTPLLLEVKGDTYKTGNMYIETIANVGKDTPGCMTYTVADYLIYYFVRIGQALWVPVPELQEWIKQNIDKYPTKNPITTRGNKVLYASEGHPVPVVDILLGIPKITQMHFLSEMD